MLKRIFKFASIKSILVTVTAIVFIAGMLLARSFYIENNLKARFQKDQNHSERALWSKLIEDQLDVMKKPLSFLRDDPQVANSMELNDWKYLRKIVSEEFEKLSQRNIISEMIVVDSEGAIRYSQPSTSHGRIRNEIVNYLINTRKSPNEFIGGLALNNEAKLSTQIVAPIYSSLGEEFLGIIIFTKELDRTVRDLGEFTSSKTAMVSNHGSIEQRVDDFPLIEEISTILPELGKNKRIIIEKNGAVYATAIQPVFDFRGEPIAYLISTREKTKIYADERKLNRTVDLLTILSFILCLGLVYRYILQESRKQLEKEQKQVRQLNRLNKQIQAANEAKGQFLANMSHEIRTPINGISGMVDLLDESKLNSEQNECIRVIRSSVGDLTQLIDNILEFSQAEEGELQLKCEEYNIRTYFPQVTKEVYESAMKKNLKWSMKFDDNIPTILLQDSHKLGQVLCKLLENAVKFTDSKGEISTNVKVHKEKSEFLHIIVKDSGIGIEANKQSLIFESFTQSDISDTREHGGAGLGLSICSRFVHLMQGEIRVESKPGSGSEFHVVVPFEV